MSETEIVRSNDSLEIISGKSFVIKPDFNKIDNPAKTHYESTIVNIIDFTVKNTPYEGKLLLLTNPHEVLRPEEHPIEWPAGLFSYDGVDLAMSKMEIPYPYPVALQVELLDRSGVSREIPECSFRFRRKQYKGYLEYWGRGEIAQVDAAFVHWTNLKTTKLVLPYFPPSEEIFRQIRLTVKV